LCPQYCATSKQRLACGLQNIAALRSMASGLPASTPDDFGVVVNGTSRLVRFLGGLSSFNSACMNSQRHGALRSDDGADTQHASCVPTVHVVRRMQPRRMKRIALQPEPLPL